jgi:hypothetical protein
MKQAADSLGADVRTGSEFTAKEWMLMQPMCTTRAMKVLKYLHRTVPKTIPRASLDALEKLPSSLLAGLHAASNWDTVTDDAQLKSWLANNPIPAPRTIAKVSEPLFDGTLVFAQVSFVTSGVAPSGISAADMQTAISYATLAVLPIQWYASQYGPNSVTVWPTAIPFIANVQGGVFSVAEFEGWVDAVAQFMRNQQIPNPCVVILHNRDLPNSAQFTGERNSHHLMTDNGTPYIYSLVQGEGLSITDNNHMVMNKSNENVYAIDLSHEIAEMIVDPTGDNNNPEVCDACSTGCNSFNLYTLFDQNFRYMGATQDISLASGFAFFINSIVRAGTALDSNFCITQGGNVQSACIYPPPLQAGQLLSYLDDGTPGNVSDPVVVGFGGWLDFNFLFAGTNVAGDNRIYAVNASGQLLSYGDDGITGNVSNPVVVGFGGWLDFKFLFAGTNVAGDNRIYAVNAGGQLLSYGDDGITGNVSSPVVVGLGGWLDFKFLFAGTNAAGDNRIYAVNASGQLLSYGDDGNTGNVSSPVVVGEADWRVPKFLFAGANGAGDNRIYAVNAGGQLLSFSDDGTLDNVSHPVIVGFDDWLDFKLLFCGRNVSGSNRIYAVTPTI